MIASVIEEINAALAEEVTQTARQIAGIAVPVFDQQNNKTSLFLPFENSKRLEPDNRLAWQSAHQLIGGNVVNTQEWGSLSSSHYDINMVLMVLSMQGTGLHRAISALGRAYNVQITGFENETMRILSDHWQLTIDAEGKGVDPRWFAFIVRYKIVGVAYEDFAEFTQQIDYQQPY